MTRFISDETYEWPNTNSNYIPQIFNGEPDYGRILGCVISRHDNYINKMYIKVEIECNESSKTDSVLSIDNIQLIISGIVVENINVRFDSYFIGNDIYIPIDLKESIPMIGGNVQIKVKFTDDEDKCGEIMDAVLYVEYKELKRCEGEEIKEFNFNKMLPYSVVSCIGDRRCGKSWLIRDIMSNLSKKIAIKVEKLNFNRVILDLKENKEKSTALVIEEDGIPSDYWKSTVLKNLVINSYHYNLMVIMSIQSVICIPPPLRVNIDYVFIFSDLFLINIREIMDV
jgi:hypothetical protein